MKHHDPLIRKIGVYSLNFIFSLVAYLSQVGVKMEIPKLILQELSQIPGKIVMALIKKKWKSSYHFGMLSQCKRFLYVLCCWRKGHTGCQHGAWKNGLSTYLLYILLVSLLKYIRSMKFSFFNDYGLSFRTRRTSHLLFIQQEVRLEWSKNEDISWKKLGSRRKYKNHRCISL